MSRTFKKRYFLLIIAVLLAAVVFIPPVRAAAESALAIFRVADTKTITISISDLEDMLEYAKTLEAPEAGDDVDARLQHYMEQLESQVRPLDDADDFTAFPVHLPKALENETPAQYALDPQEQSVILDAAIMNEALGKLGATVLVGGSFDGMTMTVKTPPVFLADYGDVTLAVTENAYIDAPDGVLENLKATFLSIPAIPENLRAQLAAIDPKTRDIYLPVVEGLGRETDLGGTTGYVYSTSDLADVLRMLPDFAGEEELSQLRDENASVLLWVKNGALYVLAGQLSDSELSQIARSVR
jgi:hypothetical protein